MTNTIRWGTAAILFALTLALFNTPGTGDVVNWLRWAESAEKLGLSRGFESNHSDYPPLTTVFSLWSVRTGRVIGLSPFHSIKLGILLFQVACTLLVFAVTKSSATALGFYAAVLLNAVPHGYVDVVMALPFLIGLWALGDGRFTLSVICFVLAAFIKPQPLIAGLFLAGHVIAHSRDSEGRFKIFDIVVRLVVPGLAIAVAIAWWFGLTATLDAYRRSMTHPELSANALNFNWILTHLIRVFDPHYGGLEQGRANWMEDPPLWSMVFARVVFVSVYVWTLVVYLRGAKTIENLLRFCVLGYLAFFIFNTGVHENHLFPGMVLAIMLASVNREELWPVVAIALITNINMFLFEGINGDDVVFRRVIADTLDLALPLAIVNVTFFGWYWWKGIRRQNDERHSGNIATSDARFDMDRALAPVTLGKRLQRPNED